MNSLAASAAIGGEKVLRINQVIRQQLQNARRILILSHIRPDGDAIGALLGLGLALTDAGKETRMVLVDGIPHNFRHLQGSEKVHRSTGDLSAFDYIIVVDCADLQRAGVSADGTSILKDRQPDLNIDHHITNLDFGRLNLVLPEQVATSAVIAEYLPLWSLRYNKAIASALLTGIVTDTIGFRTSNVTPEALRLSAMLMEHGADLPELYTRALVSKTFEAAQYWGFGLSKIQREKSRGLVWTSLTLADREQASYGGNDDADLVNLLSTIEGDVAVIFVEQKNNRVKVSWRARPGYDVSQIALQFGGGGHAAAAGADITGGLEDIQRQVLDATRAMLARTNAADGNHGKAEQT